MLTPAERAAMLDAVGDYLDSQREVVETFVGNAYEHGRTGIADLAGKDIVRTLDQARIDTLVQGNFDLIVSVADRWMAEVQDVVSEGVLAGESPVDIAKRLSGYFDRMPGNWSVIARDQVAKAQLEGRNATYREIGSSKVEVTCAPDACEECTPFDSMVVGIEDEDSRPQFHIQCACMDVPVPDEEALSELSEVTEAQEESGEGSHSSEREAS